MKNTMSWAKSTLRYGMWATWCGFLLVMIYRSLFMTPINQKSILLVVTSHVCRKPLTLAHLLLPIYIWSNYRLLMSLEIRKQFGDTWTRVLQVVVIYTRHVTIMRAITYQKTVDMMCANMWCHNGDIKAGMRR